MSDYTKVTLEADARGRLSISQLDDKGAGGGHRFCGPKFIGDETPVTISHTLDAEDGFELALCVSTLDDIHVPGLPPEWAALATAQNYLRRTLVSLARCERNGLEDASDRWRAQAADQRAKVAEAALALAASLSS